MLVAAAIAALTAATASQPAADSVTRGLGYAALSGGAIGSYVALEFFPGQLALQVIYCISSRNERHSPNMYPDILDFRHILPPKGNVSHMYL